MNETDKKLFGLLTMCRRAGKAALGFDAAKDAAVKHRADLILLSSDISAKTGREIGYYAEKNGIATIRTGLTMNEFDVGLGKKTGIIAICDKGFAKKTAELIDADTKTSSESAQ